MTHYSRRFCHVLVFSLSGMFLASIPGYALVNTLLAQVTSFSRPSISMKGHKALLLSLKSANTSSCQGTHQTFQVCTVEDSASVL